MGILFIIYNNKTKGKNDRLFYLYKKANYFNIFLIWFAKTKTKYMEMYKARVLILQYGLSYNKSTKEN